MISMVVFFEPHHFFFFRFSPAIFPVGGVSLELKGLNVATRGNGNIIEVLLVQRFSIHVWLPEIVSVFFCGFIFHTLVDSSCFKSTILMCLVAPKVATNAATDLSTLTQGCTKGSSASKAMGNFVGYHPKIAVMIVDDNGCSFPIHIPFTWENDRFIPRSYGCLYQWSSRTLLWWERQGVSQSHDGRGGCLFQPRRKA